jgi:hypothetical protein
VVTSYEHYNESSALGYGKDDKSFVELKDWWFLPTVCFTEYHVVFFVLHQHRNDRGISYNRSLCYIVQSFTAKVQ